MERNKQRSCDTCNYRLAIAFMIFVGTLTIAATIAHMIGLIYGVDQ